MNNGRVCTYSTWSSYIISSTASLQFGIVGITNGPDNLRGAPKFSAYMEENQILYYAWCDKRWEVEPGKEASSEVIVASCHTSSKEPLGVYQGYHLINSSKV